MIHANPKFKEIQDPTGRIPEDEPVFLLRARDPIAVMCVRTWLDAYELLGGDEKRAYQVREHIAAMQNWKPKKLPGA